jgi:dolichol-phosphate mannosyltransferase
LVHLPTEETIMQPPLPSNAAPILSVVVPLLNEEAVLGQTYRALKAELDGVGESYEIVFVDDGSTDRSRIVLTALAQRDPAVRIVCLSRNFGHEMATTAGLRHARGHAAIVIDADLQDPPELIPELVRRWREGHEVVYGVRQERKGETALKKLTSFLFYRLMRRIADVPIPADTGDFRLLDRRVLDLYAQFDEDPRFFRGLISWIGLRQVGVPFVRRPRAAGQTKYRYGRLLRLAMDTITAFSTRPAHWITLSAGACAGLSALFIGIILCCSLIGVIAMQAWMWAALGFLVLWNLQFLCVAVLGEYIVRTHRHTQRRPLYIVDKVIEGALPLREPPASTPTPEVFHPSALYTQGVN